MLLSSLVDLYFLSFIFSEIQNIIKDETYTYRALSRILRNYSDIVMFFSFLLDVRVTSPRIFSCSLLSCFVAFFQINHIDNKDYSKQTLICWLAV